MAETRTLTLAEFLLARIDEDEAGASEVQRQIERWEREQQRRGQTGQVEGSQGSIVVATLIGTAVDPIHVLAECAAKRRLVDVLMQCADRLEAEFGDGGCADREAILGLRLLALPYADHPDYREEWRP